ncbi:hypothetical protein L1987_20956 [Smallanthus sonchifolius]|uniref:Uncharacterized protein n=1 Tax=Smallanthus sonchifolius TaxID=185202 RepID=A0ACB9IT21_9ASTR|nr:hypothetical protein L1987_20956 [Smallanthus sonchifolius]
MKDTELWECCEKWGSVVDVYIARKMTQFGKRFGFVWFLEVENVEKLVKNLCSVWIGSYHVFADVARINRKERKVVEDRISVTKGNRGITKFGWLGSASSSSYASVLVGVKKKNHHVHLGKIVTLDKTDLKVIKDHTNVVLGYVNDVQSMANLFRVCKQEGFMDVEIVYVRGKWVWLECQSSMASLNFK